MKIFVAGATGTIGLPLVRALCTAGHEVTGMTRAGAGVARLREVGARVAHVDAFDLDAVRTAMAAASPDVVIDQLTWLPANPAEIIQSLPHDTRLKREGSANLLTAAEELGVRRFIVQSRGFDLDAPAGELADEHAGFRLDAPGEVGKSALATGEHDARVVSSSSLEGVVLRYGFFYGPGTWYRPDGAIAEQLRNGHSVIIGEGNGVWSFVHIDDAVTATVAALTAEPGTYNVVDDDPLPVAEWLPAFAQWAGTPSPQRMSREDALQAIGAEAVFYHTILTGASNARAKAKLGFAPRPLLWKNGSSR